MSSALLAGIAFAQVSKEVLDSISTPNEVETSIGTLKFLDGAPLPETAQKAYDYLDTSRAITTNNKLRPIPMRTELPEGSRRVRRTKNMILSILACGLLPSLGLAQDAERDLAKELANPIASLYTLPLQMNYDRGIGPTGDGSIYQLNAQPLIPFSLNEDWHLISRTIIPFIHQEDVSRPGAEETGIGDILQSFFFSPSKTPANGWIWGAGPVFQVPTASNDFLGIDSWALGPTGVVLKQEGQWTGGVLVNHLWSLGDGGNDYNATYAEPWVSYVLPPDNTTTISLSIESFYDWNADELGLPINLIVDRLLTIGDQNLQIGATVRYWADSPKGGPEGWGFRLQCTFFWPN